MSDDRQRMHLSVRAFPAFWVPRPIPGNIKGRQGAEKFAAELAAREGVKVCLSIPGEQDVWFDEKGQVVFRSARSGSGGKRRDRMGGNIIKSLEFPGGGKFEVVVHDLLKEETDAIVNAANSHLAHGGGVAAAISRAAGAALDEEGRRIVAQNGPVPVGEGVVTTAGKLPFKGVIHVVGPQTGEGDEEEKLVRALRSAFRLAHERGWKSVSFPGVSSGIFAVPHDICSRAYVRAVESFFREFPHSCLSLIRLVLFEGPLLKAVVAELG